MEALIYNLIVVSFLSVMPQSHSENIQIIQLVNMVNHSGLAVSQMSCINTSFQTCFLHPHSLNGCKLIEILLT